MSAAAEPKEPRGETKEPARIAVAYEHTPNFPQLLEQLDACLLISTYQAGKLLVVGVYQGNLAF